MADEKTIAHEEAHEANEQSVQDERNTAGVLSPDPATGRVVPSELVGPTEVVDPHTGTVLPGSSNPSVSTPQPNPKSPEDTAASKSEPLEGGDGEDDNWVGKHTV